MLMRDVPATLRRRWYLTIFGALGTVALCFASFNAFPPTYEASASIVLLPPKTTVEDGGNPYLQLSDLKQAVDVMTRALTSQSAVQATNAAAPDGTFEVLPDYATNGPIFIITAEDRTPEATLATLKIVTDMVDPTLNNLQAALGIAPESQITASTLTSDNTPSTVRKTQIRALIVAVGVGVVGSALVIALVDSFLLMRRARRRPVAEATATPTARIENPVPAVRVQPESEMAMARPRRIGLNRAATTNREIGVGEASTNGSSARRHG
jgi:capsular polysaccharide biosynthesis protein